jgi:hypothetical protein
MPHRDNEKNDISKLISNALFYMLYSISRTCSMNKLYTQKSIIQNRFIIQRPTINYNNIKKCFTLYYLDNADAFFSKVAVLYCQA